MGVTYNPKIVTNGLVLCLDAANSRSYPKTGTTSNVSIYNRALTADEIRQNYLATKERYA